MNYYTTYIRPMWLRITGMTLSYILNVLSYYSLMRLLSGSNMFNNSRMKEFFIVSIVCGAIVFFPFYRIFFREKYDKEFSKHLLPFHDQIMFYPVKINGVEPVWIENYIFEAELTYHSVVTMGRRTFIKLLDKKTGYSYLMFASRFNKCMYDENITIKGKFTFDTNWKISNIVKVD